MTDPFAGPAAIPTEFPTIASFRGRLVLIRPLKSEMVPNTQGAPGQMQDRITADITVVDGRGPVPGFTRGQPNGQTFTGPDFRGVYISQEVIVKQLADGLRGQTQVLAWIDTRTPGTAPGKGNPWGLIDATQNPEAVQTARSFLATRTVAAAAAPAAQAAAQPQYADYAAVQAPYAPQTAPVSAPPVAVGGNPFLPEPGSAPAGGNPFA